MNLISNYVKECIQELELVRWPTRQQAVRLSAIVLAFTVVNALAFGAIDIMLENGLYILTSTL
jgi:preprotein translocase SecE subunit